MSTRNFKFAMVAVVVVWVCICGGTVAYWRAYTPKPSVYTCSPGPNEMCASDIFYKGYGQWQDLRGKIAKEEEQPAVRQLQGDADQLSGMERRLETEIEKETPRGFKWNLERLRYTADAPSAPVVAPPVATPPPVAPAKKVAPKPIPPKPTTKAAPAPAAKPSTEKLPTSPIQQSPSA